MKDIQAHLEKVRVQIAECELIRHRATELKKRELFTRADGPIVRERLRCERHRKERSWQLCSLRAAQTGSAALPRSRFLMMAIGWCCTPDRRSGPRRWSNLRRVPPELWSAISAVPRKPGASQTRSMQSVAWMQSSTTPASIRSKAAVRRLRAMPAPSL